MRKFLNIIEKVIFWFSFALFIVFCGLLIYVSSIKHGKEYNYSMEFLGVKIESTYEFIDDETLRVDAKALGVFNSEKYQYRIDDGDLYLYNEEELTWEREGRIDQYQIKIDYVEESEDDILSGMEIKLTCDTNITLKNISIILMVVFGVIFLICFIIAYLDIRGVIKLKSEQTLNNVDGEETQNTLKVETTEDDGTVAKIIEDQENNKNNKSMIEEFEQKEKEENNEKTEG